MALETVVARLEQAKRQFTGLLNDLDRVNIPSAEKDALADQLDRMVYECDAVIEDVEDLERWISTA